MPKSFKFYPNHRLFNVSKIKQCENTILKTNLYFKIINRCWNSEQKVSLILKNDIIENIYLIGGLWHMSRCFPPKYCISLRMGHIFHQCK